MKIMADLDAVHLGLDENEADIAEELQDFDDSFDTRSEASSNSDSDSQPSISSVSTTPSSIAAKRTKRKIKKEKSAVKDESKKTTAKRALTPVDTSASNGKTEAKKKRKADKVAPKAEKVLSPTAEKKKLNKNENTKKSKKKSVSGSLTNIAAASSNKSDVSDTDEKPEKVAAAAVPFQSDSESEEDSDSAANIKRNGRKFSTKSASPEKPGIGKSYDYMTKINYLFRDTRFFLIKSNNSDNVTLSKSKNVWSTLPQNDANLTQAFKEARNVLLIFSVNESGKFAGFARMSCHSRRDIPQLAWVLPSSIAAKALSGVIEIDWICRKELSFNNTSHLYNSWNEGKPVKIGRDGQEIEPKVGAELCRLFPEDENVELTPILRKSKETAKVMREKGIRLIYKPPRSLSTRGRGANYRHHDQRRDNGGGGGGPMRPKRSFDDIRRPPYMPSSGFNRNSPPYRNGPSGPNSRSGGGDSGLPPWERYMTSAAAAEAYVADYMRTMHGQLPPLPFMPPFGQLPLSASSSSGSAMPPGPPSMYEQLPPPVRYYDGPPLPDYPPPQAIRPPPPSFDKAPSYEDFAAWKNAGLPTVAGAPFPVFGNSSLSASNGGGSIGGPSSASGSNANSFSNSNMMSGGSGSSGGQNSAYRSRENNANLIRGRERIVGARDYRGGTSGRSGSERDRHFRVGGGSDRGGRSYREGVRR